MYKTISQVLVSPVNHSKSKQTHAFSRQPRFPSTNQSYCHQSAYNLSITEMCFKSQMNRSLSKFNRQKRFKQQDTEIHRRSLSPSPNNYIIGNFVDQLIKNKAKPNFNKQQKLQLKDNGVPGPGKYNNNIYNPEKQLSYTMRNKTKKNDTHWNKAGPGQYDDLNSINNLKKPHLGKINKEKRFKTSGNEVPAPGNYQIVEQIGKQTSSKYNKSSKYRFGQQKRTRNNKNLNPGPGQYNHFSEFSCDDRDFLTRSMQRI